MRHFHKYFLWLIHCPCKFGEICTIWQFRWVSYVLYFNFWQPNKPKPVQLILPPLVFGNFWCPVETLETTSSTLSNFERNPKNTTTKKQKKIKKLKISKNPKIKMKQKKSFKKPKNIIQKKSLKNPYQTQKIFSKKI